ncbi:chaplin [Kitasatospora sp. HPMI-4]|uniref:chaplin n=1 Tax=Kitasatospora sp. HPMI-4 TaxID=3448443 RepID=UPI003F1C971D
MTNTKKYLSAAGLAAALAIVAAGPAVAGGSGWHEHDGHDHFPPADCLNIGNAYAKGFAVGSPGVLSGNNIQIPVNALINICGNTIDVVGVGNPAIGGGGNG